MHLARQADGAHGSQRFWMRAQKLRHDLFERLPPLAGRLLRPERLRPIDRECRARHADDAVIVGEQQRLELGRAEVESQIQDELPAFSDYEEEMPEPKRVSAWRRNSLGVMPLISRKRRLKFATLLKPT
jgi:hypothetical protein